MIASRWLLNGVWQSRARVQWAPGLTYHDPLPPLPLEEGLRAPTPKANFVGDDPRAIAVAQVLGFSVRASAAAPPPDASTPRAFRAFAELAAALPQLAGSVFAKRAAVDVQSQGPNSAGTGANDNSVGTVAWTAPGNITVSDDSRATAACGASAVTQYLVATGFGFAIPSGATILGVLAEVERSQAATGGDIVDFRVRLVKGGTIQATDKASASSWPASDAYASYGGSADLWGSTWTDTDINASNFGLALAAANQAGGTSTARVDYVRITVYYTGGTVSSAAGPRPIMASGYNQSPYVGQTYAATMRDAPQPALGLRLAQLPGEPNRLPTMAAMAGGVMTAAMRADPPFVPGSILPPETQAREPERPGWQGGVIALAMRDAPQPAQGLRIARIVPEAERPGWPGGAAAAFTKAQFIAPPGALVARPVRAEEPRRPGELGRTYTQGKRDVPQPAQGLRIATASVEPRRPGEGGLVRLTSTKYPPIVAPQTPRRPVGLDRPLGGIMSGAVETLGYSPPMTPRPWPARIAPPPVPTPEPRTVAVRTLRTTDARPPAVVVAPAPVRDFWNVASWMFRSTKAEPRRPAPRPSVVVEPFLPRNPGGVVTEVMVPFAAPPGRPVPRVVLVRELPRPGEMGRVLASMAWPDAITILQPCPTFDSEGPADFYTTGPANFNTRDRRTFKGKRC